MDFIFEYKNSFSDSFCDDLVTYFENKKEFHEVNNKYEVGRVGRPYERIIDRTDTWLGCLRHKSYVDNFTEINGHEGDDLSGPSKFVKTIDKTKFELINFFNHGIIKDKPSSTGLTLVRKK